MLKIDSGDIPAKDWYQYMVGAIAPRPIAFVSTIDKNGIANLAPFSYFNVFSASPPVLVFSVANKSRPDTSKDTLMNARETREVVINMVSYNIVRQMALTSVDFNNEVDEFKVSGLTPVASDLVRPSRVAESPIQFECKVKDIISLGNQSGAGNMIICEVLRMHLSEDIIDENGRVNPHKADLMGRMGRAFYARASGEAIYTIVQARNKMVIGYQRLPESAVNSHILTANNLGQLAGLSSIPEENEIDSLYDDQQIKGLLAQTEPVKALHQRAKIELKQENLQRAARIVWLAQKVADMAKRENGVNN